MARSGLWILVLGVSCCVGKPCRALGQGVGRPIYHSPLHLAYAPNGRQLAASDHTAGALVLIDPAAGRVLQTYRVSGRPSGVTWSQDGRYVFAADSAGEEQIRIGPVDGSVTRLLCGQRPVGLVCGPHSGRLISTNWPAGTLTLCDVSGSLLQHKPAGYMPYLLAITADEKLAIVGNRLPAGEASDPLASAAVALVKLDSDRAPLLIRLPPNSTNVCGITVSGDSRWAYVAHNLGRAMLPTEQIEFGWISANAVSVIDLPRRTRYATILLDRFNEGAANPFGLAISPDNSSLWVTLSGVHQLGRVDLVQLHTQLERQVKHVVPAPGQAAREQSGLNTARGSMTYSESWQIGMEDPHSVELVVSDLPVEYGQGRYLSRIFYRTDLPGQGACGVAVSPDGRQVAVAMYFSGDVLLLDAATMRVQHRLAIGPQPAADEVRRGEMIFHDANYCFQRWLSCSTCHPDGRADGLNWDLLNDGIGNPKNTRSLVLSAQTPPAMSHGVRENMPAAVLAGFKSLLFQQPSPEALRAVEAYVRWLPAEPSPWQTQGRLSDKARRGRVLFEEPRVGCARCHPSPLYTDLKPHDVGARAGADGSGQFDTPTLVELWRTAPYLHHGGAATLRQTLTTLNPRDTHGTTSHLSSEELDALIEYLLSL